MGIIIELQNKDFLRTTSKESNNLKKGLFEIDFKWSKSFARTMIITTFGSTYNNCKQAFPLIKYQKNKYYSRLSDEHYLIQF